MLNKRNLKFLIPSALLLSFFLILSVVNYIKIAEVSKLQSENRELFLSEASSGRERDDYFNNISGMIAHDLNRTRASLGLSSSNYPFKDLTGTDDDPADKKVNNEMIDAVEALLEAESMNRKSAMLGRFFRNETIADAISSVGAEYEKISGDEFAVKYDGKEFVRVSAADENEILLKGLVGGELSINSASREAASYIAKNYSAAVELEHKKNDYEEQLKRLADDPQIKAAANDQINIEYINRKIIISTGRNEVTESAYVEVSGTEIYYRLSSEAEKYHDIENLKSALVTSLNNFDLRTADEVMIDNVKQGLETKLSNQDFLNYLSDMNLNVSTEAREDLDYYYYDVSRIDGTRVGSFSILKKLGDIYLVDSDEVPVSSLKTLGVRKSFIGSTGSGIIIPENIPEIDSLYSNKDTVTFILVGNHEKNTDTMILVHADKTKGKAYLIGIPRDLYWKGRKINSIYLNYGPEQFKKELSEITGLQISNYIIVDMYAFIDIVNILGGIEVTLEEDLVDPTYKIRENGEWSTLNYKKGTYKLNGVEALRVARSRHGSNDFERSKRQQQIIEAFLDKMLRLKITDIDKVYSMMQAMFEYVDTDFTLVELMSLFNNYNDVKLAGKHVLSFDNILYDTYSNLYLIDDEDMEIDENFNRGAWILLPLENNWNNIRWYIRQIINGEI